MNEATAIDTRLLRLTDELIAKGVAPNEAASIAAKTLLEGSKLPKPWLTPVETCDLLGLHKESLYRALNRMEIKGAKKFLGQWRIPASAVLPGA